MESLCREARTFWFPCLGYHSRPVLCPLPNAWSQKPDTSRRRRGTPHAQTTTFTSPEPAQQCSPTTSSDVFSPGRRQTLLSCRKYQDVQIPELQNPELLPSAIWRSLASAREGWPRLERASAWRAMVAVKGKTASTGWMWQCHVFEAGISHQSLRVTRINNLVSVRLTPWKASAH